MRSLNKITRVLTIYDIKACYDIALINLHTTVNAYHKLTKENNIYKFIYGDRKSICDNGEHPLADLNYRYRSVDSISKTRENNIGCDNVDIIAKDIVNTYKEYYIQYKHLYKMEPIYKGVSITEDMIISAITKLKSEVTKLIFKLFHGSTVYTLLLDTPVGRAGLFSSLSSKLHGSLKQDIFDTDFASFKDYLIFKGAGLTNLIGYIDIQGLTFHCLQQYFSEVNRNPDIQKRYALYSARDIETSKGVMDKASRDLLELKSTNIPEYSLTKLFNRCRELDNALFLKRNTSNPCYSIIEWYAEYTSKGLKAFLNQSGVTKTQLPFMCYQECFENTLLLKRPPVDIADDFSAKIQSAKTIFVELYQKWYLQKDGTVDSSKISSLCRLCENEYSHRSINYNVTPVQHYGSMHKKTHGVLDVSNVTDNGENHYINLKYYLSVSKECRDIYTSVKPEEIAVYTNKNIQANAKEGPCSFMNGNLDLDYILLPAGLKRIQQILDIFQELDNISSKLDNIGATMQEILPAYYNNKPCTLEGALVYVLQEERIPIEEPSNNPLFDSALLESLGGSSDEAATFDWSLPKWYKDTDTRTASVDMDLLRITSGLFGLGQQHYPRYLEVILFIIISQAFPKSIADNNYCYYFVQTLSESLQLPDSIVYNGVDYTKLMQRLGCIYPEKQVKNDILLQDTDYDLADFYGSDDLLEVLQALSPSDSTESPDSIMDILAPLESAPIIEYTVDLRKEFFTESNVNSLYNIVVLTMLLCNEFYYYKTKSYSCDYVGLNANTKVPWTTKLGGAIVGKFKEVHDVDFKDLGPRVEDVISKIAGGIQYIFNSDDMLSSLSAESAVTFTKDSKAMGVIDIISEQIIGEDESLRIPALAELTPDIIKERLLAAKHRLTPFTYGGREYTVIVASIDMIIFNGLRYKIEVRDGYMYAMPFRQSNNCKTYSIPLNGTYLTQLNFDDGWKLFFNLTQNNAAIKYLYCQWEPKIRELIVEMCKSTYDSMVIPIIFTPQKVWQLVRYMFCDIPTTNGQVRPYTVTDPNAIKTTDYKDPDCPPSKLISEVSRQVTNVDGTQDTVYEYKWTVSNHQYPYVLDYLAVWNNAKMLLEALADAHQVAQAFHTVATDTVYRYNPEYKEYLYQCFVKLLWKQPNTMKTSVDLLNWSVMCTTEDENWNTATSKERYSPFKPIRWNISDNINNKSVNEQQRQLVRLQSHGIRHYLGDSNIVYHVGSGCVEFLSDVLGTFVQKISDITATNLFAVKGTEEYTDNTEQKIKIYNMYHDILSKFVSKNRQSLNAIRIGAEKTGRSLQSEKFYRMNEWYRDPETGILCTLDKVPYMIKQDKVYYFLYYIGYWIGIDMDDPTNVTYLPYEELK